MRKLQILLIKKLLLLVCCVALSGCQLLSGARTATNDKIDITVKNSNQRTNSPVNQNFPVASKAKAWEVGNALSLAALLYDAQSDTYTNSLNQAKFLGQEMEIEIPVFPVKTKDKAKDGAAILSYLLTGPGKTIGEKIKAKYDQNHADLYEMSLKTNLLMMLYAPGEKEGKAISNVIKRNAARLKLPEAYWQPVVRKVEIAASFEEVQDAVLALQKNISSYLETEKPEVENG